MLDRKIISVVPDTVREYSFKTAEALITVLAASTGTLKELKNLVEFLIEQKRLGYDLTSLKKQGSLVLSYQKKVAYVCDVMSDLAALIKIACGEKLEPGYPWKKYQRTNYERLISYIKKKRHEEKLILHLVSVELFSVADHFNKYRQGL